MTTAHLRQSCTDAIDRIPKTHQGAPNDAGRLSDRSAAPRQAIPSIPLRGRRRTRHRLLAWRRGGRVVCFRRARRHMAERVSRRGRRIGPRGNRRATRSVRTPAVPIRRDIAPTDRSGVPLRLCRDRHLSWRTRLATRLGIQQQLQGHRGARLRAGVDGAMPAVHGGVVAVAGGWNMPGPTTTNGSTSISSSGRSRNRSRGSRCFPTAAGTR